MNVKIYIEDDKNGNCTVLGRPCRFVGSVKNNSELIIEIDSKKHRIFANVSLQPTDTYADTTIIPAGEKDIVISGKNVHSPLKGNPFIFDKA